jgi:putative SOS response-associated peptidase YedK
MCARVRDPEVFEFSEIKLNPLAGAVWDFGKRRYNVPPTEPLPVITYEKGERRLQAMRWGLIPSWAKDMKVGFSTFNARADSLDTKAAFKAAWAKGRRCLIVTGGFYEWKKLDPSGKEKHPYAVALGNKGPMLMAGLWDVWKNPADGQWLRSCTVVTTEANEMLAPIHDRMPVILDSDDWPAWLGEAPANDNQLKAMLKPYPSQRMTMWPVDRRVGNVKNEGPELAEPIASML